METKFVPSVLRAFDHSKFNLIRSGLNAATNVTVITGAGCSTESGIPDYRSPGVGVYAREKNWTPILGYELSNNWHKRQRYWARNYIGYQNFASKEPSTVHKFMADWELGNLRTLCSSKLRHLITQNVDGLHVRAGNRNITELHGCTHRTNCLDCGHQVPRWTIQEKFDRDNPDFLSKATANRYEDAPDADALIDPSVIDSFNMAECDRCGSDRLKPDVVFFGDNVPRDRVDRCYHAVDQSDALLVLGSTLEVYSSFRFALRASKNGIPIYIVNIGQTRAQKLNPIQLECQLAEFCTRIN